MGRMIEVTRILDAIEQGDPSAAKQLLPLVYDELRRLAARKAAGNFLEKLWCAAARIAIGFRTENKRKKGSMPFWSAALFRRIFSFDFRQQQAIKSGGKAPHSKKQRKSAALQKRQSPSDLVILSGAYHE